MSDLYGEQYLSPSSEKILEYLENQTGKESVSMARNMCYDHTFVETRETLMTADNLQLNDLTTALIGTLCNCILLQGRFEQMCERWVSAEIKIKELEEKLKGGDGN